MRYDECSDQFSRVELDVHAQLKIACQENIWLQIGGVDFVDDPTMESEYDYTFITTQNPQALEAFFQHGNWSIRTGVVYRDLAFINQINGGDEWWTLKNFEGKWVAFESITFRLIIRDGEFESYLDRMLNARLNENGVVSY